MGWWSDFRDSVLKPVAIGAAIVATGGAAGAALFGEAVAAGTISAGMATAIGTGLVAGGYTGLQGGSPADMIKSALTAGTVSFIGGQLMDALKGSGIAQASIDAANATTDPVAALNANQGWTQSNIEYLNQIGASASAITQAINTNASKFNVQPTTTDLSVQNYANTAESLQAYDPKVAAAFKSAGIDAASGVQNANGGWTFTDAAGKQVWAPSFWNDPGAGFAFDATGNRILVDQSAAASDVLAKQGLDPATHTVTFDSAGTPQIHNVAGGAGISTDFAAKLNATSYGQQYGIDNAAIQNYKNMGYSDSQILKAVSDHPNGGWGGAILSESPAGPGTPMPQPPAAVSPISTHLPDVTSVPGTSVFNPDTGMTETTTPGTGTNPVATVTLTPGDTTTPVTTTPAPVTTPINPIAVAGVGGAVGAGTAPATTPPAATPPATTPPGNNLPPVEDLSGTGTPGTNNPLGNGDQTLAGGIGNWSSALLESVGLAGMSSGQIMALMAAGALAPSVLQALGIIPKTTAKTTSYGPLDYTPLPKFEKTDLAQPGLNPGLMPVRPYYQTTNELQDPYYWGRTPYIATAEDIGKLQNIPGAPAQSFGWNAKLPNFDVNKFIQQTITPQQSQALAGQGGPYQVAGAPPVQQAVPIAPSITVAPVHQATPVIGPDGLPVAQAPIQYGSLTPVAAPVAPV